MNTGPQSERTLGIRFVGSGSEYFRIWIVNLLLTVLTFGLYYPFAKVRRLRYFYGCTEVDGHPLEFHGKPWLMLRGYALVAVLGAAYAGARSLSEAAAGVALLLLVAIGPGLWHSSLRFRLANTAWRGVRLHFAGTLAQAYRAALPAYGALALALLPGVLAAWPGALSSGAASITVAASPLLTVIALPWLLWRARRHVHDHCAFAGEQSRLALGARPVYAVFGRAGLLSLAVGVGLLSVLGLLAVLTGALARDAGRSAGWILFYGVLAVPLMIGAQVVLRSYLAARLQNLFWSATASANLRFASRLRARSLMAVMGRNWSLILVTLGLYYPFAAVAQARVQLEAVTLHAAVDVDTLVASDAQGAREAAGDAAADLLGIDIGL